MLPKFPDIEIHLSEFVNCLAWKRRTLTISFIFGWMDPKKRLRGRKRKRKRRPLTIYLPIIIYAKLSQNITHRNITSVCSNSGLGLNPRNKIEKSRFVIRSFGWILRRQITARKKNISMMIDDNREIALLVFEFYHSFHLSHLLK